MGDFKKRTTEESLIHLLKCAADKGHYTQAVLFTKSLVDDEGMRAVKMLAGIACLVELGTVPEDCGGVQPDAILVAMPLCGMLVLALPVQESKHLDSYARARQRLAVEPRAALEILNYQMFYTDSRDEPGLSDRRMQIRALRDHEANLHGGNTEDSASAPPAS